MIDEPVTITYTHPKERVLFNAARDANPFMHLYESLWMLAGRNDVAPLVYYTKRFADYSDDGKTLNGAYGYRWRGTGIYDDRELSSMNEPHPIDQLPRIVEHLKANPTSRRAVLQMWNVEDDLMKIDSSKDVCCNLSAMFSVRDGQLDMTVTNRSNDLIWGLLGANVVHFSVLQEYMAAHLGVEVGVYNQFTNNAHAYMNNWKPVEWLSWIGKDVDMDLKTVPLVRNTQVFDQELPKFVKTHSGAPASLNVGDWREPFLLNVAQPMLNAFHVHKRKQSLSAANWAQQIQADDWRIAATQWLERRRKNGSE